MRKAGVADYAGFAQKVLAAITDRPISFEVFADEFAEMTAPGAADRRPGAANVYVKIPVTNTRGESTRRRSSASWPRTASSSTSPR